jgi:hypothetical protein
MRMLPCVQAALPLHRQHWSSSLWLVSTRARDSAPALVLDPLCRPKEGEVANEDLWPWPTRPSRRILRAELFSFFLHR